MMLSMLSSIEAIIDWPDCPQGTLFISIGTFSIGLLTIFNVLSRTLNIRDRTCMCPKTCETAHCWHITLYGRKEHGKCAHTHIPCGSRKRVLTHFKRCK